MVKSGWDPIVIEAVRRAHRSRSARPSGQKGPATGNRRGLPAEQLPEVWRSLNPMLARLDSTAVTGLVRESR